MDERRQLYDALYAISSDPIACINRALVIAEVENPEAVEGGKMLTAYAP